MSKNQWNFFLNNPSELNAINIILNYCSSCNESNIHKIYINKFYNKLNTLFNEKEKDVIKPILEKYGEISIKNKIINDIKLNDLLNNNEENLKINDTKKTIIEDSDSESDDDFIALDGMDIIEEDDEEEEHEKTNIEKCNATYLKRAINKINEELSIPEDKSKEKKKKASKKDKTKDEKKDKKDKQKNKKIVDKITLEI